MSKTKTSEQHRTYRNLGDHVVNTDSHEVKIVDNQTGKTKGVGVGRTESEARQRAEEDYRNRRRDE